MIYFNYDRQHRMEQEEQSRIETYLKHTMIDFNLECQVKQTVFLCLSHEPLYLFKIDFSLITFLTNVFV